MLIVKIAKEAQALHADGLSQRKACMEVIAKYPIASLKYSTVDRWAFRWDTSKLDTFIKLQAEHRGKIRVPIHVQHMSESRIERSDLESEVYMAYRHRKDVQKKQINFKFFERLFKDIWSRENLPVPSKSKIHGFLKRRRISMQAVRDTKTKTAEERIDKVRDQLVRLDEYQRSGVEDPVYGRCGPENMWQYDKFALSVQQKVKRSYGDKGGEDNHVKHGKDMFSREMTGIFFARYLGEQPKKTYAIISLKCR